MHTQPKNRIDIKKNEDGSDGDGSAPDTGYGSSCIAS